MDAIETFFVSLVITLIGFFLTYIFTKKPKLRFYYGAITDIPFPVKSNNNAPVDNEPSSSTVEASHASTTGGQSEMPVMNQASTFNFIRTHTVVISNQGNATANNVRIGHYFLPAHSVSPPLSFRNPENMNEIIIPILCAKEAFTISYLYPRPILWKEINAYFKCDEGAAEIANLQDINIRSPVLFWLMKGIFYAGAFSVIYFTIKLVPVLYKLYLLGSS